MAINEQSISGKFEEVAGSAESAIGGVVGDASMQAEGKIHELKGKAEQAFGKAKEVYGKASDTVKDWAEKAPETAREARDRAAKLAEQSQVRVKTAVQEQPLAVLAGGVALGFVVGWLLSSRRD